MLTKLLETIRPLDENAMESARLHWDAIAKPLHSLGRLEDMIVQLAGICENPVPAPRKKAVLIFCADNGIVAEGVTQTTQDVTAAVTQNFAKGIASVNALSRICGAEVFPVDIGVAQALDCPGVLNRKVAFGTQNFAHGPAMRRDEAEQAVCTGIDLVQEKAAEGYNLIVTGEMGIGNTTTSSAVFSVLQGLPPEQVTGRGAGLSEAGLQHKIQVISRAVAALQPDPGDVYNASRVSPLHSQRPVQSFPCAVHKFLSHALFFVSVQPNPDTPARCALCVPSAPFHLLRISFCMGSSCTVPVCCDRFFSHRGPSLCALKFLPEGSDTYHLQRHRYIPKA